MRDTLKKGSDMTDLLDRSIGSIACDIPGATQIFHEYKLDFCCGGHRSLRESLERRNINDPQPIFDRLAKLMATQSATDSSPWQLQSNDALIDHILLRFHQQHREDLPELIRLARRVEQVHGERSDCPKGLADHLSEMQQELESHMMKEEQILFPMLRRTSAAHVSAPISMMRFEHDQHGESLSHLEQLTHDMIAPVDACNTWQALYAGLRQLREDLMQHIHLENNILFNSDRSQTQAQAQVA